MTVQLEQARHLGHDLGMGAIATGDEINLRELWLALCRRRKLVAVTAVTVLTLTVAVAVYQRIFNSVYIGSFSLLITDPISSDNSSSSGNGNAAAATLLQPSMARPGLDVSTVRLWWHRTGCVH